MSTGSPVPPPYLPPPNWQNQPTGGYFPQPIVYPVPQSGSGWGFTKAIFTTLAVSIFGFSLTLNIYLLAVSGLWGASDSPGVIGEVVRSGTTDVVAIIPVEGIITGRSAEDLEKILRQIRSDTHVKAIILEIDSPGGEVTASDEIYQRLVAFKQQTGLPLIVSMKGLAASGGYYIACAGDYLLAQRTTTTGSIGVMWGSINVSKLMEKYGVEDTTVVSSGSKYKLAGSPTQEFTPDMRQYIQSFVDDHLALFKSVIVSGRNLTPQAVDQLANGQIFNGTEAVKLKLIDQIGFLDDAIAFAEARAGIKDAKVVRYRKQLPFWEALVGTAQSNRVEMQLGPARIKVDQELLNRMLSPRPMFLMNLE